ncbi:TonB-dependent receptor [uncultured Alistipes sp.]|uniref:SusC/RagA family TonB-linked outer membrane protein n=1 Tax=uncultured Alistipes sp. TaxID=538949 RepID=UPI0025871E73|nr:TonB-dependent receptor [uncultured Alistipes sp.]
MQEILTLICRFRLPGRTRLFAALFAFGLLLTGGPATAGSSASADDGRTPRTGTVKDSRGNAVGGATIVIEGTTLGVTTDSEGGFSIDAAPEDVLLVNFIGYTSQSVPVGVRSRFEIVLEESATAIDEVMVVGYGTRKKTTLTGSVVSVKGEEIASSPAIDVASSLAGRLPGLIVNARAGDPGAPDTQIFVRGRGTTGDNSALIIVDGVERGDISKINPNDIESINVLKDAEAAIYGSRAANGVILVTTKRGAKGRAVVNFSYDQGFQQPTRTPKMADSYTFASVANEMAVLRHSDPNSDPVLPYTPEDLAKFKAGKELGYRTTDWYRRTMHKWVPQHRTNVSVSGGSDRINYFFSAGELMQRDRFKESSGKYRQYNVRSNIDVKIARSLTMGLNLAGTFDKRHVPYFSSTEMASHIFLYHPYWETYWPGTNYLKPLRGDQNWVNMVSDNAGYHDLENKKFQGTLFLKWEVPWVKGLMLEASGSYDTLHEYWKTFRTPSYVYHEDGEGGYVKKLDGMGPAKAQLTDRSEMSSQTYFFAKVSYKRSFGDHNLDALLGYEQTTTDGWYLEGSKTDFASPSLPVLNVGPADQTKWGLGGYSSENARQNVFARVNYDYKGKYMAQVTMRIDGSAIFPEEDRFGYFPSFSAGWRISEETFMKSADFIDNLKLRASWGMMGNDRVAAFQHMMTYNYGNNYVIGGSDVQGLQETRVPNPGITWEVSKTWNFGLEASFWNSRLWMEFDFFRSVRDHLLTTRNKSVPEYTGMTLPNENIGKVLNRGFELVIGHRNRVGEFGYSVTGNLNFARNKVLFIDEAPAAEPYQMLTGNPIGSTLFYEAIGIFQDQADLDSYPHMGGAQPGDLKFRDVNKDGVLDSKDRILVTQTKIPEITFGLNFTFNWKNFDLSLLFQGQQNSKFYMEGNEDFFKYMDDQWGNFLQWRADGRWIPGADNTHATQPRGGQSGVNTTDRNTHFMFSGNFLRFKNAELGYTLPSRIAEKLRMGGIRISLSANNICFLYDGLKDLGYDGEASSFWNYSICRTINVGINLTF